MWKRVLALIVIALCALVGWILFNRAGSWTADTTAAAASRAAAVQGCWLARKGGRPDPFLPGQLLIVFDTTAGQDGMRRLVVDTSGVHSIRRTAWAPAADSPLYRGFWGDGTAGLEFRLRLISGELHGRAFPIGDARGWWPTSFAFVAARAPCSGLLPN